MKTGRLFLTLVVLGFLTTTAWSQGPWEYWRNLEVPIMDFSTATSSITIPDNFTIGSMQVMVDIQHTYANDLVITLDGPGGTWVLSSNNGSNYDNYENTIFDPVVAPYPTTLAGLAVDDPTLASAYFRGVYMPQAGTTFPTSGSAAGTWTINVYDSAPLDQGKLVKWGLIFNRYYNYKDVRWGNDINALNMAGMAVGSRLYPPFVGDFTSWGPNGWIPQTVHGYRPQANFILIGGVFQNSKLAGVTKFTYHVTPPSELTFMPFDPLEGTTSVDQFNQFTFYKIPDVRGTYTFTGDIYQRGDLYMTRNDNNKSIDVFVTPGSMATDAGVSQGSMNPPVGDCEANLFEIVVEQTLTSIDVWEDDQVELEDPLTGAARVSARVWDASSGVPLFQVATTVSRRLPKQGTKWVTYDFTPPIVLLPGRYGFGICIDQAPSTGGLGLGLDQQGSPFDPDGILAKYSDHGIEFFSTDDGVSWNAEYLRYRSGKMIRPNFILGSDVGVISIDQPPATLPSSFSPVVTFGSFAHHPSLPNAVTLGKVYIINNTTGQQVYYSERRVYLQNAPYTNTITFDPVSGLASGSYTIRAEIERPLDEENFINNSYSRQYVKPAAPITISHYGKISPELQSQITTNFDQMGVEYQFVDRSQNPGLPTEGYVVWVGSISSGEAAVAREFVKNGNDFVVLPENGFTADMQTKMYETFANPRELETLNTGLQKAREATQPSLERIPQVLEASLANIDASVLAGTPEEQKAIAARMKDALGRQIGYSRNVASLSKYQATTDNVVFSRSEELRIEGLRLGNLAVAQVVMKKNAPAPRVAEEITTPDEFQLTQNYPNPFNPTTNIAYNVIKDASVSMRVYDVLGRQVSILVNGMQNAGKYIVSWDGRNDHGDVMPSGVYLYRMEASPLDGSSPYVATNKMVMTR